MPFGRFFRLAIDQALLASCADVAEGGTARDAERSLEGLSRHKKPRAYLSVSEFPRNAQGKVQRSKLLGRLLQDYRIEDGPRPRVIRISDDAPNQGKDTP